ncbi:hypothetical protein [Chryseobacterium sp. M5A1_1a]
MKIINKYPVFADVVQIGESSYQFKFKESPCFDHGLDFFVVNIYELKIPDYYVEKWIENVKEDHLNMNSVITIDENKMEIFTGNFNEEEWGDWCTSFSAFEFESYDTQYIQKTQKDWDDELLLTVRIQVLEKMCRSVTDQNFRQWLKEYCEDTLYKTVLQEKQRKRLTEILEKINTLNASSFYDIFVWKSKFEI